MQLPSWSAMTPRARIGRRFLLVRVLHRVRTVDDGVLEDPERDAETLEQAGELGLVGHQNATFRIAVTAVFTRASGMSTFQAKVCS